LNLEEIGRRAGVSRSTVSRVINGAPNVSADARQRVEVVVAETGYRPHAAARSLASNRNGIVGLIIANSVETVFDDPYFGRLILGVTRTTNDLGTTLTLFLFREESEADSIYPRVANRGLVDGVIVTATRMGDPLSEHLAEAGLPFVVVGRPDSNRTRYSVDVDNFGGARLAAEHLIGLGRTKLGLIAAPSNTTAGVDRRRGFLETLSEAGLDPGGRIIEGDWTEASGRRAMLRLLAENAPDAVFAASDRMAAGALRAIREAGLTCPGDIAVVSFDGIIPPDQTVPRLTAVVQPVIETGEQAASLLHAVIDGEVTKPEHVVLPTRLVVRESCGAGTGGAAPS